MNVDFNKISSIIKEQMKHYEDKLERGDVGAVISVGDGICLVNGLDNVMALELLNFPNDVQGMALNLEENYVGVVIFGNDYAIKEGDLVKRTGKIVEVPVGDAMLGRVVNALGKPIDGKGPINTSKFRPIERIASGVMARQSVNEPLQTGIKAIDSMIPIGKGQRELIIGDRQTGKTTVAIDTILNQKGKNVYCIYVAIGQKNSTVINIAQTLKEHHALSYTTIVNASAGELSPLQYIAPYSGCAIGEEWMENGKDVLIVYDDLSKHAVAYRTMSLLLRRPPGREAYPGDVFYLHSRLLERSAKLNDEHGGGSLTALPIIETQAGDISAYIPTNVISITDGQIFLKADLFNSGFRPALDTGLSVSRVGSAAQIKAMKQVSGNLKIELAQFNELQSFTQFGSDLDDSTKRILEHGQKVQEMLKQTQYKPLSAIDQVITFFVIKNGFVDQIAKNDLAEYEKGLHEYVQIQYDEFYQELVSDPQLDKTREKKLRQAISEFTDRFKRTHSR